jgi:cytidine deaminase
MSTFLQGARQQKHTAGAKQVVALALFGLPGAGKTTSGRYFSDALSRSGFGCTILKLAEPLYELQAYIYEVCGHPLTSHYAQDGPLLQDLGMHVRRIDDLALLRHFTQRFETWLASEGSEHCACICDDVRAPDAERLRSLGFLFVEVTAPDDVRAARCAQRGDLVRASEDHYLEARPAIEADLRIENGRTLRELQETIDTHVAGFTT